MSAINFGNLLDSLSGILEDASFIVTPDQIVRAHAVLLRLGAERSPSGLVSLLSPIFCSSTDQQDQFTALFIRALDLTEALAGTDNEGDPRVIGRSTRRQEKDPDEIDREIRAERELALARRPRIFRALGACILALALLSVLIVIILKQTGQDTRPAVEGASALNLPNQKEKIPKSLPLIDGKSTLDIEVDSSGREAISESLLAKAPVLAIGITCLAIAGIFGIGSRRRSRKKETPNLSTQLVVPPLPKVFRFGSRNAVAAANQLNIAEEGRSGRKIDVQATIQDHIRAGYWKDLRHSTPELPSYVAVLRLPNPTDAQSLVSESIVQELRSLGVSIEAFYYEKSLQECFGSRSRNPISIRDIAREHGDDRLLVFSDGSGLVSGGSNRAYPWTKVFQAWSWRHLALPSTSALMAAPHGLTRLFKLTVGTMKGLSRVDKPDITQDLSLHAHPSTWPTEPNIKKLTDRIARWLGPNAFQWFATCAIYSHFNGSMLLFLGEMPELGELSEEDFARILALPYSSDQAIPEKLRLELLDRLNPKVARAARKKIVQVLEDMPLALADSSEAFRVEYAALRWLANREMEDRAKFAEAVKNSSSESISTESTLFALTQRVLPYWTKQRKRAFFAGSAMACFAVIGILPFIPFLAGKSSTPHVAPKPLGTDFGDWICFTKIEQAIHWQLPADTEVKKLSIIGYDQSAVGEGFQLVSRAQPGMTIGPIDHVDGPQAGDASVVFEPLHAKQYTGLLNIETNHGTLAFGLRGTGVYGGEGCVDEGHGQLGLESDFNGNGCNEITEKNGSVTALLAPARPTGPSDTHSALVLGPWRQGDFDLTCGVRTIAQLRDPAPFGWEVGWIIWNFVDLKHFYYLALKGNGWEIGRRDNLSSGGQRFLATKDLPIFPPGRRYLVHINRSGDTLTVDVDGKRLVSIEDNDHPVTSGRIGFYSECAASKFDSLEIK